jgi:RNA polymerase sigma factor (sigma-70 family)
MREFLGCVEQAFAPAVDREEPAISPGELLSAMSKPAFRDAEIDQRWSGLMSAAQAGDRASYERLLRECAPFISRLAGRQGVRGDGLDDVVQDVLTTVHRVRHTYDPTRSFTAWLRAIAQRRAIDHLRSRGRLERREIYAPLAYEAHADDEVDHSARSELAAGVKTLNLALVELTESQREAIEHLALRELSLDEAAAATGRSKGALKVNLHRALKSLRARLQKEG